MEFTVEFYVNASGCSPVEEFLDELKQSDPGDHAAVLRGLAKLRNRQYHREPLSKERARRGTWPCSLPRSAKGRASPKKSSRASSKPPSKTSAAWNRRPTKAIP